MILFWPTKGFSWVVLVVGTNEAGVNTWDKCSWLESVVAVLDVFVFLRGWFAFKFHNSSDATKSLAISWKYDSEALFLKHWTPLFDQHIERYDNIPIWVKLPHLSFELWSKDFFKLVGDSLGSFVEVDMSSEHSGVVYEQDFS